MATLKARGTTYCVIYPYRTKQNEKKQQWETYTTELEAVQRKAYIDYLQKCKKKEDLLVAVNEYKNTRAVEKAALTATIEVVEDKPIQTSKQEENMSKTYRELAEKWLPFHARKKRMTPESYDGYKGMMEAHILPYFGEWVVSSITAEDIDHFVDHLNQKPCRGAKSYGKMPNEIPTLASSSVKKIYNILNASLRTAKIWKYISEMPETVAPSEKGQKRKAWPPQRVYDALDGMKEDKLLHLAVHIAFVCSMRAGEMAGISAKTIDFHDRSFWIVQEIQRVSDESLAVTPSREIIRVFPKIKKDAKTSLILKGPKTEGSTRKQYLTTPLLLEIKKRLDEIERNKEFFGEEYEDYGLLLCMPNGKPFDPNYFTHAFREWQIKAGIDGDDQIDFQGLRKSGQMHKVRLTNNNYQLVAENGGQSPEVLMSNYNEAYDSEKRTLSLLIENNFYANGSEVQRPDSEAFLNQADSVNAQTILDAMTNNPDLMSKIMQLLLSGAVGSAPGGMLRGVAEISREISRQPD